MNVLGQNSPSPWTSRDKFRRGLWQLVESTLFRWSPSRFHSWRCFLLRLFGATIPSTESSQAPRIWPDVQVYFPWKLVLNAGAMVGPGVRIYNLDTVSLGEGANLSRHIHLCAGSHDFGRWSMPLVTAPITIERNVWIATDCYVGPGVTIGELAVVGARSVVVKNLPPSMICVGNPCVPIKPRPIPQ